MSISCCEQLIHSVKRFEPVNRQEWMAVGITCATTVISTSGALFLGLGYLGYKWVTTQAPETPTTARTAEVAQAALAEAPAAQSSHANSAAGATSSTVPINKPVLQLGGDPIRVKKTVFGGWGEGGGGESIDVDTLQPDSKFPVPIGKKIASGGYGVVLETIWEGKPAAVKAFINTDEGPTIFKMEAAIHAAAPLGSVPMLYAVGPNYLVMEKFDGNVCYLDSLTLKQSVTEQIITHYLTLAQQGIYWLDVNPRNVLLKRLANQKIQVAICDLGGCAYVQDGKVKYIPPGPEFLDCGKTALEVKNASAKRLIKYMTYWDRDYVPQTRKPLGRKVEEGDLMIVESPPLPDSTLVKLGFRHKNGRNWTYPSSSREIIAQLETALGPDFYLNVGHRFLNEEGGYFAYWSIESCAAKKGPLKGLTSIPI